MMTRKFRKLVTAQYFDVVQTKRNKPTTVTNRFGVGTAAGPPVLLVFCSPLAVSPPLPPLRPLQESNTVQLEPRRM